MTKAESFGLILAAVVFVLSAVAFSVSPKTDKPFPLEDWVSDNYVYFKNIPTPDKPYIDD